SSDRYGSPAEAVTETKQQHLRKAAAFYLKERKPEEDFYSFDVIEISLCHLKGVM
nr:YraN family protein [Clostridia bacterium]